MSNREVGRLLAGFVGAAAAASLTTTLGLFVVFAIMGYGGLSTWRALPGSFLLAFVPSAVIATTLGLMWHAFALRRRWHRSFHYWIPALIAGATLGFGLFLLPASTFGMADPDAWTIMFLLTGYGAALGGLTGYFAWLIRRPDRDAANPATPAP
jgi:hypothetical protein